MPAQRERPTGRQRGKVRLRASGKADKTGAATVKLTRKAARKVRAGKLSLEISCVNANGPPTVRTATGFSELPTRCDDRKQAIAVLLELRRIEPLDRRQLI